MRLPSILVLLVITTQLFAQSTIESVPNQKLITGSYVSNPDNVLDEGIVFQIDTLLKSLENKTTVQVAVVALESIGNEDIFEFAQKLFVTWGIGNKDNDNGLLLLLVKDQRTIRFHTGYGLEGVLPDIVCKRIQRESMVPEFKNGNYSAGMLAGLRHVQKVLTDPVYAEELKKSEEAEASDWPGFVILLSIVLGLPTLIVFIVKATRKRFADSKNPDPTPYAELRMKRWTWLLAFVGIPVLIIAMFGFSTIENPIGFCLISLYLYFMAILFHRFWRMKKMINRFLKTQDYYEIVEFIGKDQVYWFFMGLLFPVPFLPYFFYHLSRKRFYRNHPRDCKQCQGAMHKLDEKADDEFLSEGQKMEEQLLAVDYDVWKCIACGAIDTWFYRDSLSGYQPCPKCKTITYSLISNSILKSATYSSSGAGEEVHTCKFCGHSKKSKYTIAKLVASSSSDSGSSSSGGGGSSGGGSWGGGSSGGGGASSSW